METELKDLVGKTIKKIFISQDHLKFETDSDNLTYVVSGDCCSNSYFFDFYGVKNLIDKQVKEVKRVDLMPGDVLMENTNSHDEIQVYGYQIFTEGEYGDQTAVFSFRNASNGYYGGSIDKIDSEVEGLKEITEDIVEVQ